jgi:hypothetical protein
MKYYQVRPIKKPNINGVILRADSTRLEVYAGETELRELGASLNQGSLVLNESYVATEISRGKAKEMRRDYINWKRMQLWASGSDEAMGFQTAARLAGGIQ